MVILLKSEQKLQIKYDKIEIKTEYLGLKQVSSKCSKIKTQIEPVGQRMSRMRQN